MDTPTTELLPCPFCGKQPRIIEQSAVCETFSCAIQARVIALNVWNTRSTHTTSSPPVVGTISDTTIEEMARRFAIEASGSVAPQSLVAIIHRAITAATAERDQRIAELDRDLGIAGRNGKFIADHLRNQVAEREAVATILGGEVLTLRETIADLTNKLMSRCEDLEDATAQRAVAEQRAEDREARNVEFRRERDEARNALTGNLWSEWEIERAKLIVEHKTLRAQLEESGRDTERLNSIEHHGWITATGLVINRPTIDAYFPDRHASTPSGDADHAGTTKDATSNIS